MYIILDQINDTLCLSDCLSVRPIVPVCNFPIERKSRFLNDIKLCSLPLTVHFIYFQVYNQ